MGVLDIIKKRRSIRSYKDKEVERDKLKTILEAARLSPSASNRQEWRFVIVEDKDTKNRLKKAAKNQKFVGEAPVVITCCAQTDFHVMTCGQMCYPIDLAIAIEHMVLTAQELGLGTCWVGAFNEDEVKEILNIPSEIKVVELLSLGYSKVTPPQKEKLPLAKIAYYNEWAASFIRK